MIRLNTLIFELNAGRAGMPRKSEIENQKSEMIFVAIYVPDFPVAALVRTEPELRETALAVVEGTPPLLNVVGRNERARRRGVEPGMTAMQAEERLALAADKRAWQIRRRSSVQEQAAHAALLDCAYGFSPRVEETAADTVLLDLDGLERLLGPPAKVARALAQRVREIGLQNNIAIAGNPDAAMHAARGFPGVTVIATGKEAERLGGLPVDILCGTAAPGCADTGEGACATASSEMLETLDRWGIRTFRQLAALPETAVAQRLGQEGVYLRKLARGEERRPLRVSEPPLTFEEAAELEYPVAMLEPLAFLLNRMLEQLCARLAGRALAAQELRLRMELDQVEDPDVAQPPPAVSHAEDVSSFTFQVSRGPEHETRNVKRETSFARAIKLPVPMLDAKVFLKLLQLDLQAHPPGAPVLKIWLAAEPAEPRHAQGELFVPVAPEPEKLELTLARIKAVVSRRSPVAGNNSCGTRSAHADQLSEADVLVGSPEVLDTHRPDAFRMSKFNPFPAQGPSTRAATPAALAQDDNRSPSVQLPIANCQSPVVTLAMRIFRPPLAVAVELHEGRPAKLRTDDGRTTAASGKSSILNRQSSIVEVLWSAGPWRGSGEWWSEQAWSREEWDVTLKNGDGVAFYRIYRDGGGAWFVEAEYD